MRLTAGNWPVSFRLDDSMSMLPSRRLSQFQKVIVEARLSRSGQATAAPGDLYVTSDTVNPGSRQKLALVINHEIG
jgi:cytochrome c-type biogenesis protein CcmH